jgi:hypothetical protein
MKDYISLVYLFILVVSLFYYYRMSNEKFTLWSESRRFKSVKKDLPPCFEMSQEAQDISTILNVKNTGLQFYHLFDAMSIVLCQLKDMPNFNEITFQKRMDALLSLGAKETTKSENIVGLYNIKNPQIKKFLVYATTLIEMDIHRIRDDQLLSREKDNELHHLVLSFYEKIYPKFNTN